MGGEAQHAYLAIWLYRMLNSRNQLQEKMALFWNGVFATGLIKNEHILSGTNQIEMFRRNGMSDIRSIFMDLATDPAMIFWLDNNESHLGEPNENWGRELLKLFSLGVGNYSEIDIKHASRAFTGWTFAQTPPLYPHGYYPADFLFDADDHDNGEKEFLGHKGNLDGGDIHRDHRQATLLRCVYLKAPLQLFRGGRATGSDVERPPSTGSRTGRRHVESVSGLRR